MYLLILAGFDDFYRFYINSTFDIYYDTGGMIIASSVLMIVIWKTTLAAAGWKLGFNIYLGLGVAVGSFFTAIMWFMDVKKMGLIPI